MEQTEWEKLTPEQKKKQLYLKQKELLDTFLEHHAISKAQYDKSLHDMSEKMGYGESYDDKSRNIL
jgi:restriction endonuclease Mrr